MRLTSKNGWRSPLDSDIINAMYKKLAAYEDAEEQGRLVILPCKAGDKVYALIPIKDKSQRIRVANVYDFRFDAKLTIHYAYNFFGLCVGSGELGKTVFLTREEAEAALKGGQDDG